MHTHTPPRGTRVHYIQCVSYREGCLYTQPFPVTPRRVYIQCASYREGCLCTHTPPCKIRHMPPVRGLTGRCVYAMSSLHYQAPARPKTPPPPPPPPITIEDLEEMWKDSSRSKHTPLPARSTVCISTACLTGRGVNIHTPLPARHAVHTQHYLTGGAVSHRR